MSSEKLLPKESRPCVVLSNALPLPLFNKLRGKRVVLASASPRRNEILRRFGLGLEIIPSKFPENLSHFDTTPSDYVVATATEKAIDVYSDLVSSNLGEEDDAPDLVIGCDTIVVFGDKILEKPNGIEEQYQNLLDFNGNALSIITAVTLVQPSIAQPGYTLESLVCLTTVTFADNTPELIRAYVTGGEGLDKAGGFAIQGQGGLLIKELKGDYNSAVGFPAQAFFEWLARLTEEESLCELD